MSEVTASEGSQVPDFSLSQETHILSVPSTSVNEGEQPNTEENFEAVNWDDAPVEETEESSNGLKIDAMLNSEPVASPVVGEPMNGKMQMEDVILPVEAASKV